MKPRQEEIFLRYMINKCQNKYFLWDSNHSNDLFFRNKGQSKGQAMVDLVPHCPKLHWHYNQGLYIQFEDFREEC